MTCEIQTSFPPLEVQPPTCDLSLRHTHNTYSPTPPIPRRPTPPLSHFHRAFFQEIRLIRFFFFFFGRSLSAVVGCRQCYECVYQRVTDIVVDQQVVKLIITSSNHVHVWWNGSRPASFSSGPKASLYSTGFETARHRLKASRCNPGTLTKQQAQWTSCCFVCYSDCKV